MPSGMLLGAKLGEVDQRNEKMTGERKSSIAVSDRRPIHRLFLSYERILSKEKEKKRWSAHREREIGWTDAGLLAERLSAHLKKRRPGTIDGLCL